jgi:hypothetical protein
MTQKFLKYTNATVSFTDLDQGREILSRFSLPKSMKHSEELRAYEDSPVLKCIYVSTYHSGPKD